MTAAIFLEESESKLQHKFSISWRIENARSLGEKTMKTPVFPLIPNSDATFYLEFEYFARGSGREDASHFKATLFRNYGANLPKCIKMNVILTIRNNNVILKKYTREDINVAETNSIVISNAVELFYTYEYSSNSKGYKEKSTGNLCLNDYSVLVMKCDFTFYGHLSSPADYFHDMENLENLKVFLRDFDYIHQPAFLSDIEFKVGNESLPAHKSILAAHSPVFRQMMSDDFLESKTNIIPITDSTPEIINSFLKYLYCGEIEDKTWPVVRELYILADKYDVSTLRQNCKKLITSLLSVENICEILRFAYDFEYDDLKSETEVFVLKNFHDVSSKDEWKELIQSHPLLTYEIMLNLIPKPN